MFALGGYQRQLQAARQQAASHARTLLAEHNILDRQLGGQRDTPPSPALLRQLSEQRKTLNVLGQRSLDASQLADVYQSWGAIVESRHRGVLHLVLRSLAAIIAVLLVTMLLSSAMNRALRQMDRRRLDQARAIARTALRAVAVLLILMIVFGLPAQLSALIGLVTALLPFFPMKVNQPKKDTMRVLQGNRKARGFAPPGH